MNLNVDPKGKKWYGANGVHNLSAEKGKSMIPPDHIQNNARISGS